LAAKLTTRNVFIDTEAFDSASLNFGSTALQELTKLAQAGKIHVFLTSVTVGEINEHIGAATRQAAKAVKEFRRQAPVLYGLAGLPFHSIFKGKGLDVAHVEKQLHERFGKFLKDARVTLLDVKTVNPERVFESYFLKKHPFGEGKNKSEFPDAFALASLRGWCAENRQKMYAISRDRAIRAACGQTKELSPLSKIEEFIDLVNRDQQKKASVRAFARYTDNLREVENAIRKAFVEAGFYLEDEDGDAEDITIETIDLGEPSLLEVDDESATFSVSVNVEYTAEVSYSDYGSGSYDNEDKIWMYLPTREETVEEQSDFEAEIYLQYEGEEADEDVSVDATMPRDFGITVQPTAYELK
jgi:PIN domain